MRFPLAVASVGLVWFAGSSGAGTASRPRAKPASTAPKAAAPWKTAPPVIPEWAPANPSPEFLRAARVLKPLPLESVRSAGRAEAENAARVKGATILWPAGYEFFGTLSDAQISRFLRTKQVVVPSGKPGEPPLRLEGSQVLIPIRQLTRKQRAAMDKYLAAWREAWKGRSVPGHPESADLLLKLYRFGAARDLSNVVVGFDTAETGAGHSVSVVFSVKNPDGTARGFGSNFAQI